MPLEFKNKADHANYHRISEAIHFLIERHLEQPTLSDLSSQMGLSEFHLQRMFSEWAGVTPKQFLQYLTKEHAKNILADHSVMEASHTSGLSGGSRLHDLLIRCEGVTPGEFKKGGLGLTIRIGFHKSRFGPCLIAATQRGLCKLAFFDQTEQRESLLTQLRKEWPNSDISKCETTTTPIFHQIFENQAQGEKPLKLLLKGSPFRLKVWEALLRIPEGGLVNYQSVATMAGSPKASRAVGSAIGANPIAYVIPCHRVIRSTGVIGEYRWGRARKGAMIGWEQSQKG